MLSLPNCTELAAGENEENVRYVLDKFPEMQLVQQPVVLGGPGLVGPDWLTAAEAALVQRFDPAAGGSSGGTDDTIGFFIAKFRKTQPGSL
jgi:16S rRNA C967 or C1407 C5-methylase (RsmB/RsmF family)